MKREQYHYFVEGEDDRKVVNTLKTDLQWIKPGKVQVFNVIEEELTSLITRTLKPEQSLFWYLTQTLVKRILC